MMENGSVVALKDFSVTNEDQMSIRMENNPIHIAAREGDAGRLRGLLREKSEEFYKKPAADRLRYPKHWKYHFRHLLETDEEGRTALHLAAAVGNPEMSLETVRALMESVQLFVAEKDEWTDTEEKQRVLVNAKDHNEDTALLLAVENRAAEVVSYLLDNQANMMDKTKDGTPALALIYEHLPEAMTTLYDDAVQLTPDHKGFNIDWGPVIGFRRVRRGFTTDDRATTNYPDKSPAYKAVPELGCESENLKYVLSWDQWGAPILNHGLVKLYLEKKWEKIQWFFWITFMLEMFWLLLYTGAFMSLNLELKSNETEPSSTHSQDDFPNLFSTKGYHVWWTTVFIFTIFCAVKEAYQLLVLRDAYWSFENIIQNIFILLVFIQFGLLVGGFPTVVASVSVIGTILGTMLMVFQVGKMPYFGRQVAAWKKVIYSFAPHLPVFIIWFAGFGVTFWAVLYKAEESWLFNMVAIMAAMGTGELNAEEHLKSDEQDSDIVKACVRVLAFLFFVIIIVTLYFNLLIGYAVTDIQILKAKAETLELSNKLSTIYSIESFLTSKPGQILVRMKWWLCRRFCRSDNNYCQSPMDSIFVIPPEIFFENDGIQTVRFDQIPPKLLKPLKNLAYKNIAKNKEQSQLLDVKIAELVRLDDM